MPVISPWTIYLLGIVNPLKVVLAMCSALVVLLVVGAFVDTITGDNDFRYILQLPKVWVSCLLVILLTVLIPSETTLTKMLIAREVTYERVEMGTDVVKTVYEDILELLDKEV